MKYRLPVRFDADRLLIKYTDDLTIYLAEWEVYSKAAEDLFPGFSVTGYDPNIELCKYTVNGLGQTVGLASFSLPLLALKALMQKVKIQ